MIEISVNLATHNRASFLEACLVSLCEQTIEPTRYEICVVTNACNDTSPTVIAAMATRYPQHRIIHVDEPIAGVSRARNRGIVATTGVFIANIDDDATANPDWLERFLTCFKALPEDVAVIGGEVDPIWMAPPPDWLEGWMKGALSAASNMGTEARFIEPHEGLFEGNCCYRRTALKSVGNYPTELGRVGAMLLSGENAINTSMRLKGWRLYFDPTAVIHHTIHANRLTPLWMRQRFFWQGISHYAVYCYHQHNGLKPSEPIRLDLPLTASDWDFIRQDNAENLRGSLMHFESLGFALALSGIIPIDDR